MSQLLNELLDEEAVAAAHVDVRLQLRADLIVEEEPTPQIDQDLRKELQVRILRGDADRLGQPDPVFGWLFLECPDDLVVKLGTDAFSLADDLLARL